MTGRYSVIILVAAAIVILGCGPTIHAGVVRGSSQQVSKPAGVLEVEKLLSDLGYWILKVDGKADASTRHAIMAFQKVEGRKRTGVLTAADIKALRLAQRPEPRSQTGATHVEIDLTRQVLFLVDSSGTVTHILPVSSGNEKRYFDQRQWHIAHTPRGQFRIVHRINGVRKASLGNLYHPNYFYGGVAIHGSNSIPAYPASHGCVRIPRFADRAFFGMVKIGTEVFVYD
jgi:lipoprotein-anchoring transpeptidase ErfK/SrfK